MKNTNNTLVRLLLPVFIIIYFAGGLSAQDSVNRDLKFNKNHKFKIVQFTDIHWKDGSDKGEKTLDIIESVLEAEKPDLVVYTGDIVYSEPLKEGWKSVTKAVIEREIPWAVVLGNHDDEFDLSRSEILSYLQDFPFFIGSSGPSDLTGAGNYILSVQSSKKKKDAALLYFLDSNAYPSDKLHGDYDWIKFNQLKWYMEQSAQLKSDNKNKALPGLAFFHIPLPEYSILAADSTLFTGIKKEGIASPEINSGMFAGMLESKDVMGVFVGHDHDNDFIGTVHDIALAFGRVTGLDAYGVLERGARVIELHEGSRSFDSWIRTPSGTQFLYHFPNNELYPTAETEFLPASDFEGTNKGINYKYFEGKFKSVNDDKGSVVKTGTLSNFSIEPAVLEDYFAFEYDCWINIPEKGVYQFSTASDDGSVLLIDDQKIVDNDGSHSLRTESAAIGLDKGFHKLKLLYFESYMGNKLEVEVLSISKPKGKIPDSWLFTN